MSKLEDELAKMPLSRKGSRCSISALYQTLPDGERLALERIIDDLGVNRISALSISQAIASAYATDIHRSSVDRHRRKDCLCWRVMR